MGEIQGTSRPITIDNTPPEIGTDGFTAPPTCNADNLAVNWNITENESELKKVELLIRKATADGTMQVIGGNWITLPAAKQGTCRIATDNQGNPLQLTDGNRLALTLRATNTADLSTEKNTGMLLFDNSPPPPALITDQGKAINAKQVSEQGLQANWQWSKPDPESGECTYSWAGVKYNPADDPGAAAILENKQLRAALTWQSAGGERSALWKDANLPGHGETGYILVKTENKAGLTAYSISDGIIVDEDGPFVTNVQLLTNPANTQDTQYVNRTDHLWLNITAADPESGIGEYRVQYGKLTETGFQPAAQTYTGTANPVQLGDSAQTWPELEEGQVTLFSAVCLNQAGMDSEQGMHKGVMLDKQLPVVTRIRAESAQTEFLFDWQAESRYAPVAEYHLRLWQVHNGTRQRLAAVWNHYQGETLVFDTEAWNRQPGRLPGEEITDGSYILTVQAVSKAGNVSVEKESAAILRDTTKPVLSVTAVTADPDGRYAFDRLTLLYAATDGSAGSGISEYQYEAGTPDDSGLFTGGWVSLLNQPDNPQVEIAFNAFDCGLSGIPEGTVVRVRARVRDGAGLWSEIACTQSITVDKSAAQIANVRLANPYIASANVVYGIGFDLHDEVSGILEYRTLVMDQSNETLARSLEARPELWKHITVNWRGAEVNVEQYSTPQTAPAASGDVCYVVLEARNRAGIWSAPVFSEAARIDYEAPRIVLSEGVNGKKKADEFVFNASPFSLGYALSDAVSPDVKISLGLYDQSGAAVQDQTGLPLELAGIWQDKEAVHLAGCAFDESAYQTYTLVARIEDRAGNRVEQEAKLRVNRPPVIVFNGCFDTTSLKPLILRALVEDPDDREGNFQYQWELPDYPHQLNGWDMQKQLPAPVVRLRHTTPVSQKSVYGVRLVVTDSDGKASAVYETQAAVFNTVSGVLYDDEYWNPGVERHVLFGSVRVPAGLKLTVAENAVIEAAADFEGSGYGLEVEGDLEIQPGAVLKNEARVSGRYWKGIYAAEGSRVVLSGCTVRDAERGITVTDGSEAALAFVVFVDNLVGAHVLKAGQVLTGCEVRNSWYYGVKLDGAGSMAANGCLFSGNFMDVYDGGR